MPKITISLPDPTIEWIESLTVKNEYPSLGDYVCDLIRRDRERRGEELSIDEIQQIILDARASGKGDKTVGQIFDEAKGRARTKQARE